MDNFFDTPARKWFFGIFLGLLLISLLLIRFLLIPYLNSKGGVSLDLGMATDILKSILDNAVAAVVTTGCVTLAVLALTPSKKLSAMVETIQPAETNYLHKQALTRTSFWTHLGHYGKWVRSAAFPAMAEAGQVGSERVAILILPDPSDMVLMQSLARAKSGSRAAIQEGPWTVDRIRAEILASVFAAYCWNIRPDPLQVTIVAMKHFRKLRIDINSEWVAITSDYARDSALFVRAGTHLYDLYMEEVRCEREQGEVLVDTAMCRQVHDKLAITENAGAVQLKRLFAELLNISLDEKICTKILKNYNADHLKYK
jgi:hypothetical protein